MFDAIIQCRMSSKRLPGKSMLTLKNKPLFYRVYQHAKQSKKLDKIIIATSNEKSDFPIIDFCIKNNIPHFAGSLHDVALRFIKLSKAFSLKNIVRITGDDPIISGKLIDFGIQNFIDNNLQYFNAIMGETIADGLGFEIFRLNALEKIYKDGLSDFEKEHVSINLKKTINSKLIGTFNFKINHPIYSPNIKLCVDTLEDYIFLYKIFEKFYDGIVDAEKVVKYLVKQKKQKF